MVIGELTGHSNMSKLNTLSINDVKKQRRDFDAHPVDVFLDYCISEFHIENYSTEFVGRVTEKLVFTKISDLYGTIIKSSGFDYWLKRFTQYWLNTLNSENNLPPVSIEQNWSMIKEIVVEHCTRFSWRFNFESEGSIIGHTYTSVLFAVQTHRSDIINLAKIVGSHVSRDTNVDDDDQASPGDLYTVDFSEDEVEFPFSSMCNDITRVSSILFTHNKCVYYDIISYWKMIIAQRITNYMSKKFEEELGGFQPYYFEDEKSREFVRFFDDNYYQTESTKGDATAYQRAKFKDMIGEFMPKCIKIIHNGVDITQLPMYKKEFVNAESHIVYDSDISGRKYVKKNKTNFLGKEEKEIDLTVIAIIYGMSAMRSLLNYIEKRDISIFDIPSLAFRDPIYSDKFSSIEECIRCFDVVNEVHELASSIEVKQRVSRLIPHNNQVIYSIKNSIDQYTSYSDFGVIASVLEDNFVYKKEIEDDQKSHSDVRELVNTIITAMLTDASELHNPERLNRREYTNRFYDVHDIALTYQIEVSLDSNGFTVLKQNLMSISNNKLTNEQIMSLQYFGCDPVDQDSWYQIIRIYTAYGAIGDKFNCLLSELKNFSGKGEIYLVDIVHRYMPLFRFGSFGTREAKIDALLRSEKVEEFIKYLDLQWYENPYAGKQEIIQKYYSIFRTIYVQFQLSFLAMYECYNRFYLQISINFPNNLVITEFDRRNMILVRQITRSRDLFQLSDKFVSWKSRYRVDKDGFLYYFGDMVKVPSSSNDRNPYFAHISGLGFRMIDDNLDYRTISDDDLGVW